MSELKKLLPGEKYTTISGEEIVVYPIPFAKTLDYIDAIAALVNKITSSGIKVGKLLEKDTTAINVTVLFKLAFEEVIILMSLVLAKPKEWFTESIDFADGCALLDIIIKQNIDNERAKKNLKALMGRFRSLLQTPSKRSSAQDTRGPKSEDIQETRSDSSQKASSSSEN